MGWVLKSCSCQAEMRNDESCFDNTFPMERVLLISSSKAEQNSDSDTRDKALEARKLLIAGAILHLE